MKAIEEGVFIAGQIEPRDATALAEANIVTILNNRPDGEAPRQPTSAAIEAAARSAGLAYRHVPIAGVIPPEMVEAARAALAQGPTLMFCKSGMRSALLWAVARAGEGRAPDNLIAAARAAGVELGGFRPLLMAAGEARGRNA